MKAWITDSGGDWSDCLEKTDLVKRLESTPGVEITDQPARIAQARIEQNIQQRLQAVPFYHIYKTYGKHVLQNAQSMDELQTSLSNITQHEKEYLVRLSDLDFEHTDFTDFAEESQATMKQQITKWFTSGNNPLSLRFCDRGYIVVEYNKAVDLSSSAHVKTKYGFVMTVFGDKWSYSPPRAVSNPAGDDNTSFVQLRPSHADTVVADVGLGPYRSYVNMMIGV